MEEETVTAEAMLSEIQSESLQQLLGSVLYNSSPPGMTHLPGLDACLCSAAIPGSSARPLNRGDVIEVQGPAASGKTHFIYHLIISCIIPFRYQSAELNGWGKAAVVFDTDGTFDIRRFYQLLLSRLARLLDGQDASGRPASQPHAATPMVEDLAIRTLQNLHIFRPTSSLQLAASLLHLPNYHATHRHLQQSQIGLLVIDSLSAFHWQDRFTMEQVRGSGPGPNAGPAGPFHHVLSALQRIRISHTPVIVLTNWGLNPISKPSPDPEKSVSPFYKQHLYPFPTPFAHQHPMNNDPRSHDPNTGVPDRAVSASDLTSNPTDPSRARYSLPLTCHITLPPVFIPPFPASATLAEALEQEETYRRDVVKMGEVRGLVRVPGSANVGRFTFWIGEREIFIDRNHLSGQ